MTRRPAIVYAIGILIIAAIGIVGLKVYQHQKARCERLGGRVVTVTSYGTTYVPGGYVGGKYVSGGSVSSSSTTTNCIDRRDGHLIFGM
jgi:hypothetical protein